MTDVTNPERETPLPSGGVEVRLPNGNCVQLDRSDLAGLRTAILAAAAIPEGDIAGGATF